MASNLMLLENPWYGQPRRHSRAAKKGVRRSMRNPIAALGTTREWTQGVDLMDATMAVAGLAGATMIPGMIVKDTSTTGKKFLKLAVSLISAVGVGALAKSMVGSAAGKAAVIGGLAGTASQALGMFTSVKIGNPIGTSHRIGVTEATSPTDRNILETPGLIQP